MAAPARGQVSKSNELICESHERFTASTPRSTRAALARCRVGHFQIADQLDGQVADPALNEERVDLPQDDSRLPCRHSFTGMRMHLLARHYLFCARTHSARFPKMVNCDRFPIVLNGFLRFRDGSSAGDEATVASVADHAGSLRRKEPPDYRNPGRARYITCVCAARNSLTEDRIDGGSTEMRFYPNVGLLANGLVSTGSEPANSTAPIESTSRSVVPFVTCQTAVRASTLSLTQGVLKVMSSTRWLKVVSLLLVPGALLSSAASFAQRRAAAASFGIECC